jgi:Glycosyltransferase family 87
LKIILFGPSQRDTFIPVLGDQSPRDIKMARLLMPHLSYRPPRWLTFVVWALAIAAAVVLLARVQGYLSRPLGVFPTYYTAARLIERGERVAIFYDDRWYMDRVTEFAPGVIEVHNANPPLMGFFFLPLTPLSYDDARQAMSAIGFLALIAATWLMASELRITGVWRAVGFLAVFLAAPTLTNLGFAHVYTVVLLMLVLAWRAWRRGAEEIGGALIALVLCFKTAGLFLWPLMAAERRWRALAAGAATVAILALVTFGPVGFDGWMAYFDYARGLVGAAHIAVDSRMTIPGLIRNLFRYDPQYNPDPIVDAPLLAVALEGLLFVVIAGSAAKVVATTRDRDVTFALAIMVSLVLVPINNGNHLTLASLPAFVIFSRIQDRLISPLGLWFLVGGLLSFAPGYDRIHNLAAWGGPLFLYPRLAGSLVLLGLLVVLGLRDRRPAAQTPDRSSVQRDTASAI